MTTPTLLILADDLTGAADAAAWVARAGHPATIILDATPGHLAPGVLAVCSDSRHLAPLDARAAVAECLSPFAALSDLPLFKKIDSMMRGNVGVECAEAARLWGAPALLICPALPAAGRSVQGGMLLHAPEAPQTDLHALLEGEMGRAVSLLPLAVVRSPHLLAETLLRTETSLFLADAQTDEDLASLVAVARTVAPQMLLCGSGALAGALARSLPRADHVPRVFDDLPPVRHTLVVVGSASAMAHHQIGTLLGATGVAALCIGDEADLAGVEWPDDAHTVLLHQPRPLLPVTPAQGRARSRLLAEACALLVEAADPERLLLAGGDTATAALVRLACRQLDVLREVQPGMPLCRGHFAGGTMRSVLLKAGSHGSPDTLLRLLDNPV